MMIDMNGEFSEKSRQNENDVILDGSRRILTPNMDTCMQCSKAVPKMSRTIKPNKSMWMKSPLSMREKNMAMQNILSKNEDKDISEIGLLAGEGLQQQQSMPWKVPIYK